MQLATDQFARITFDFLTIDHQMMAQMMANQMHRIQKIQRRQQVKK